MVQLHHQRNFGQVTLRDGNGVDQFIVDVPRGDTFAYNLAEDGILFEGGMSIQVY